MLDILASYYAMQFQGNFMIQTQENGKKTHIGPDLGPLSPNSDHNFFFFKTWLCLLLDVMISYHHV